MNPRHHPSETTLAAYAAGTLRKGFGLVVAAHLERCAKCREEVRALEATGGALMDELPGAELAPDALDALLARLDEPAPVQAPRKPGSLIERLELGKRRYAAPGFWVAPVDTPRELSDRIYLLNAPPRAATAKHTHEGLEFTYVVAGALNDNGEVFTAGDFIECDASNEHRPTVHGDEACLCLFATEGRLKPASWIGGLAFAIADV